LTWLAYYEETSDVRFAIEREKQIKSWRRCKKVALIETVNPHWKDMALEWFE
jgi:putative endonuclease